MTEWIGAYRRVRIDVYARTAALLEGHETLARVGAAFTLAILTGALAQVKLYTPLTPVPYTLQVLGVALMGGLLGRKWGTVSAALYLALGFLGFPVFAGQVDDLGGLGKAIAHFRLGSGFALLQTGLSVGFLVGLLPQAWLAGWARDRTEHARSGFLVGFAPAALAILALFAALDAVAVGDAAQRSYYANATQGVFFAVLVAGLVALAFAVGWLAHTTRARRERLELFFGNIVGLGALYLCGATGFYVMDRVLGLPPVNAWTTLRFTVLPFLAFDVTKILLAVGLLTVLRPSARELARSSLDAGRSGVNPYV